ncbi:Disease resistance protein RPP2A [Hirschfeldia incana]|nr:Disease resistance protein RPP2A [Hirschfeldia incana]
MNKLTSMFGSLGRRSSSLSTNASGDRNNPSQELDKVFVMSLDILDAKTANKVMGKAYKIPGVSSVVMDGDCRITLSGTADPHKLLNKLMSNYRPMIGKVTLSKKEDSGGVLLSKKHDSGVHDDTVSEQWEKGYKNLSMDGVGEACSGRMSIMSSPACKWEKPDDSVSRDDIPTVVVDSTTTIAPDSDDWYLFYEFLSNHMPPLTPYGCSADDVIDFLRTRQVSGGIEGLVSRLSTKTDSYFLKPEDNPFRSAAVASFLKEMTRETECILVFSCSDNLDVDETSFIEAISKELHKRKVTPFKYNLLRRKKLDEGMLNISNVGIMILSNTYASSTQSLDHLVAIMNHRKAKGLVIIPIYFKVTISDICGSKGKFEAAFLQLQSSLQEDRVLKWKSAVTDIVSIGGLEWTKGLQCILAEEIVRNAFLRLCLKNSKNMVGILSLLEYSECLDVEIFGLWGMPGIGKTSLAREVFEILVPRYDLCYFLEDFHLVFEMQGLGQLRDDFFSKMFGEEKLSLDASDTKLSFMRDRFHNKKILVVLDDVSNARDAEAIVGGFGWFSKGHTIILTSRKKQVLVQCKAKELYEIQKLCELESSRLCKEYLNEEIAVISELISCSSGIPLALKALVSSVSKQHIDSVKEHLWFLRENPPSQIIKAFRRSFDGLDENEKNIFLDLACFFRGENKDHVVQILDACGFFTYLGICDLIDESLISLWENRIEMPIPFQDVGRFLVHEEDEDPCERSRLWDPSDITNVLTNNSGTDAIEGIFLDASDLTFELGPTVFDKMCKLRLLKFYCSTSGNHQCMLSLPQGLYSLPDELRLLHWEGYPLETLPLKFNPENLVELNMPYSNMEKLWEGKKNVVNLKKLKLSHSKKLTDIRMLSEALNLENVDLEGCTSLVDISSFIPRCGKLLSLNMKDCSHLQSLPTMVDLTSLKLLNLSGCLDLEEIQDFAPNLKELYLAGTAIRELPLSIENLTELVTLDLENCKRLQQLPFGVSNSKSIVKLKLSGCEVLGSLSKLKAVDYGTS